MPANNPNYDEISDDALHRTPRYQGMLDRYLEIPKDVPPFHFSDRQKDLWREGWDDMEQRIGRYW